MYCNLAKLIQFKATPGKETLSKNHSAPQWTRCHMWVEFVVGSLLAPGGFSLGTPVFPSPQKTAFLNSGIKGPQVCQLQDCYMLPLSNKVNLFFYV